MTAPRVNLIGIDDRTAFRALIDALAAVCNIADSPTSDEGLGGILDPGGIVDDANSILWDRDGLIVTARESRDRIYALIRQSRGEPANDAHPDI